MEPKSSGFRAGLLGKICRHQVSRTEGLRAGLLRKWRENRREFSLILREYPILGWIIRISVPLAFIMIWLGVILAYNTYSTYGARCAMLRAQVGVEIKRRADLIPGLAACVSRYETHEKDIQKHVSDARLALSGPGDVGAKIAASRAMQGALGRLLALVEQYPGLRAAEPVQSLIKELANTENRIAGNKGEYNENARAFNNFYANFPTNLLGRCFGIHAPMPYINTEEDLVRAYSVELSSGRAE